MNGIFASYLWTTVLGKRLLNMLNHVIFTRKYKYRCTRDYVWYKDDKHVIWMWIWLILKNISLLDRIWSLWLVRFAHSPPNFIFWLGRLIFSVSINSHPDNIYVSASPTSLSEMIFIDFGLNRNIFYGMFPSSITKCKKHTRL